MDEADVRVKIALMEERLRAGLLRLDDAIVRINVLPKDFVSREEWDPRRRLIDGLVWLVVTAVGLGLVYLLIKVKV